MIIALLILALVALPFGGPFALAGAVIGLIQAIAVLIPLVKAPGFIKKLVASNPMTADIVFSSLAAWATVAFFGPGLLLAVAVRFYRRI